MPIPEVGRAAGHVLLDAASAWDDDVDDEQNLDAANLAVERLLELDAVRVDVEVDESEDGADDEISVSVDLADVVGPSALVLRGALALLEERGLDRADAIVLLRERLDRAE